MRTIYIYKHTNKKNGKVYIGQTVDLKNRWRPSSYKQCKLFYAAIKKYGWNNFEHKILFETTDEKLADIKEIEYINEFNSRDSEFGYNIQPGGVINNRGVRWPTEMKEKISKTLKGTRTGKDNPMYGKHSTNMPHGHPNKKLHDAIVKRNKEYSGKKVYINGVYAGTVMEIAKNTNTSPRTIRYRCLKHYKGYSYE